MCAVLLGGASSASAGVALSVPPSIPTNLTVGESVASSLTVRHGNDGTEANYDDLILDLTLVPSCGARPSGADCPAGSEDPGVLVPHGPFVGRANTACAGTVFTIAVADATQGKYRFTWSGNIIVTATGTTDRCIIDFTTDVARTPTKDAFTSAGIQTDQAGFASTETAPSSQVPGLPGTGTGSDEGTVSKATMPIVTQVGPTPITLGQAFHDTATLSPPAAATPPTGSVRFDVYGTADCSGTPTFSSTNPLNAAGTTAVSDNFTPMSAGLYHVIATYLGDGNYNALTSLCTDPAEQVVVNPPLCTPPPGPAPTGGSICSTPPVCTPPPGPAPPGGTLCARTPTVCTTPPGPAPAGGELCARGTAAIRGATGCAGSPFRVVVSGRQIQRVVFTLDSRKIRTLSKPNSGSRFVLGVNPRTLRVGVHHVLAKTTFRKQSGTKARTLRVTFSRCGRRAVSPAFTG
jgi:hypothetical protein